MIPDGGSHIKGEICYSAFGPARLIIYPLWPPGYRPSPSLPPVCFKKNPTVKVGVGVSDTKVKTHLSCLNKSDKEMLYGPPSEGSPKTRSEQSGRNV